MAISLSTFQTAFILASTLVLATPLAAQNLVGSEWEPVEISGESVEISQDVFVRFEQDAAFFGNGGCNSIRGRFVTNDDAILFGPAAATMMMCPSDVMETETIFIQALTQARLFKHDGTELELFDSDGNAVMLLRQRDAD